MPHHGVFLSVQSAPMGDRVFIDGLDVLECFSTDLSNVRHVISVQYMLFFCAGRVCNGLASFRLSVRPSVCTIFFLTLIGRAAHATRPAYISVASNTRTGILVLCWWCWWRRWCHVVRADKLQRLVERWQRCLVENKTQWRERAVNGRPTTRHDDQNAERIG